MSDPEPITGFGQYDGGITSEESAGEFVLWLMSWGFTVRTAGEWQRWRLARPDTGKKGYRTIFEIYYNKRGHLRYPEHTWKLVQLWRQSLKGQKVNPLK